MMGQNKGNKTNSSMMLRYVHTYIYIYTYQDSGTMILVNMAAPTADRASEQTQRPTHSRVSCSLVALGTVLQYADHALHGSGYGLLVGVALGLRASDVSACHL